MKVALIQTADIPETGSVKVEWFGREVFVYKTQGRPRALVNLCLHLGGPMDMQPDGTFVCQWHGAAYEGDSGHPLKAPAPSGSRLMFVPTRIEDGILYYVWGE